MVVHQVVNALLTQLDKLKTRKNVLVMTTSNIAGAIGTFLLPSPLAAIPVIMTSRLGVCRSSRY